MPALNLIYFRYYPCDSTMSHIARGTYETKVIKFENIIFFLILNWDYANI